MAQTGKSVNVLEYYDLEAPYATEFRRLLHNLNSTEEHAKLKTLLITSAMLSEGKSTIAAFLAVTSARHKRRKTLLVDCDIRRPMLHRLFNLPREGGVVETLTTGAKIRDVIKKTPEDLLDIITAGASVQQPTEVFDSAAIRKLLEEVRFYYDLIIVDCAPVLPVSDPMLLATEMDGVIMVVKAGSTQREVAKRAAMLLQNSSARFLGIVLNNFTSVLPYYYNESYYGYDYKPRAQDKSDS